jgi:[NiFe] hydrogenase diaphorase moiety small subunit
LQATAYELRMTEPRFDEFYPKRPVDASHPDLWLDLNRCILCKLCVRASHEIDGKDVLAISGHGIATPPDRQFAQRQARRQCLCQG